MQLECLNNTMDFVYAIPIQSEDGQASKRRHVGDKSIILNFVYDPFVY